MEHVQSHTFFDILQLLLITAIFSFLIIIAQFHWNRRKLYEMVEKIPGPRGYPIIGNSLSLLGLSHRMIMETILGYFGKYVGFFKLWIGPKLIIFVSTPEDLEIILNHQQCLERDIVYSFMKSYLGNGLITSSVDVWRRHRKLINPTFNQKILDSFMEVFNQQANIFTEVLTETSANKDFDIYQALNVCMLDFVCETIIGIEMNAQRTRNKYYGELWERVLSCAVIRMMNIFYYPDFIFKHTKYHRISDEACSGLEKFTKGVIRKRKLLLEKKQNQMEKGEIIEEEKKWKSFLDHLLHVTNNGKALTEEELMYEVNTITAAASDSTATTLSFILLSLGLHPEIQEKVFEEVVDVLGYDRDVTSEDMTLFQYMDRCIKESLRLFPSAPVFFRKSTADIDLGHAILPADSSIVLGIFHTHRSTEYWPNPLKFDPDRFLPEEVAKRHSCSFVPFSAGPRGCIGMKYGEMAMKTVLATVIRKFAIKTEYKSIEEVELNTHMLLIPANGFKVTLERR